MLRPSAPHRLDPQRRREGTVSVGEPQSHLDNVENSSWSRPQGPMLGQIVPLPANLLSIPTGDRYPPRSHPAEAQGEDASGPSGADRRAGGTSARADPTTRESLDLMIDRVPRLS
jgi:hypothetical protein